jgi:hypothetical protein
MNSLFLSVGVRSASLSASDCDDEKRLELRVNQGDRSGGSYFLPQRIQISGTEMVHDNIIVIYRIMATLRFSTNICFRICDDEFFSSNRFDFIGFILVRRRLSFPFIRLF